MVSKSKVQLEYEEAKNKIAIAKARLEPLREIKKEIRSLIRQLKPLEAQFNKEKEAYIKELINQNSLIEDSQIYRARTMGIDVDKVKADRIKRIDEEREED